VHSSMRIVARAHAPRAHTVLRAPIDAAQESCDGHNQTLPAQWSCYDVNLTFSLPFGGGMEALVVQQAALGYVESILQQYNVQNLDDAFVQYREPKFVDSAMRAYAVGLTRAVMNNAQQELFLQVFRQGFDALLASKSSEAPMIVHEARILYQIPPLSDNSGTTASDESIRNRLDANSTAGTAPVEASAAPEAAGAAPLESNLAVHMLVRATCSGPGCHDGALTTALWEKGRQHADAWAAGIREQAQKASNSALQTYFDPLVTIVLESPTSIIGSGNNASGVVAGSVYHPASAADETQQVPTWIWVVVGVDAGILLLALLVALGIASKRRREWGGNGRNKPRRNDRDSSSPASPSWSRPYQEEAIPEQYPCEPYPNMAGLKEAAGSSHRDRSEGGDDEFHDEGSDRIFDDGIRVREAQVGPKECGGEFHDDGSDRIFDDGIRVREVQVEPLDLHQAGQDVTRAAPPQDLPPPTPSPTPKDGRSYDDGVRVSVENEGETSRVHDDGIHISNSIHDID
jgi:hypothetical protein